MSSVITAWSFSRITVFELCPLQAELKFGQKIPEPERPLPKGKTEHANDRGTRIHEAAEAFVRGKGPFPPELIKFKHEFEKLQQLFAAGKVSLEGDWGVDKDWQDTGWMEENTWGRIKLDALVFLDPSYAVVIDYKTGKRYGNEIKHAEQGQLYQLASFLRYPKLEKITVELWYTDLDELHRMTFTRRQGLRFLANFDRRAKKLTTATSFPAKPNVFNCKRCGYGPGGTGHCEKGV